MKKIHWYEIDDYSEIDEEIRTLIKTMNSLDWIQTNSSCYGHEDSEYHNNFYVQFFCDMNKVYELANVLEEAERVCFENETFVSIRCEFHFNSETLGSQSSAPEGSIAFYLTIEELVPLDDKSKRMFIKILQGEFQKV